MPLGRFSDKIFVGAVFHKLTVLERIPRSQTKDKRSKIRCLCECGNEVAVDACNLTNNNSKSCGCSCGRPVGWKNKPKEPKKKRIYLADKIKVGDRFTRLVVMKRLSGNSLLLCRCDCGNVVEKDAHSLWSKNTKSCGCWSSDCTTARNKATASFSGFSSRCPLTFQCWQGMVTRCHRKNHKTYQHYGAVGVKVCEFLRVDPRNLKKTIGLRKNKDQSIDRFPLHSGHYTCGQCKECKENGWELNIRWATRKEQNLNKGNNVRHFAFGQNLTCTQWAELSGMGAECIRKRICRGWGVERALTTPDKAGNCYPATATFAVNV